MRRGGRTRRTLASSSRESRIAPRVRRVGSSTHLIDINQNNALNRRVLENLSDNSSVSSSNDEDVLGVGVGSHRDVGDHLLVAVGVEVEK